MTTRLAWTLLPLCLAGLNARAQEAPDATVIPSSEPAWTEEASVLRIPRSRDEYYLNRLATMNASEMRLAELALQRSAHPGVRQFALRMLVDHQQMLSKIALLGLQMGLMPEADISLVARA